MKTMSSMGRPYPLGSPDARMVRDRPGPSRSVDRNRVRVRDGKECDLISIALGSAGMRSPRRPCACAAKAIAKRLACGGNVLGRRPWTRGAPFGAVHPDHPGVTADEAAEADAAGQATACKATQPFVAAARRFVIGERRRPHEPGSEVRRAMTRPEARNGTQDSGSRPMVFRARSAKEIADHVPRPRIISAKTRSVLHSAAMCRKMVIYELHPDGCPVARRVQLLPLGNKTKAIPSA